MVVGKGFGWGDFTKQGFALLSLAELSEMGIRNQLAESIEYLLRLTSFQHVHEKCYFADPRDPEDDPTSLGLQFFSRLHDPTFTQISAFGSRQAVDMLASHPGFIVSNENEAYQQQYDSESILFRSIPEDFSLAMNRLSAGLVDTGDKLVQGICQDERLQEPSVRHETLINFYTSTKAPLYPHTDHSTVTLLFVPSLILLTENNKLSTPYFMRDNYREKQEGLLLETRDEELIAIDDIMFSSLQEHSFDLSKSKLLLILAGNHLKKLLNEIPIHIPAHKISSHKRHQGRFSIAHFMHRDLKLDKE